ncbi:MAG: glycosyltransferase family 2 protein [Ruminococcaceae bacterium]|nr:glycosyltransferase family 2 protein [Oscillospiraceae bacterium]
MSKISVLVATYNNEKHVGELLKSVSDNKFDGAEIEILIRDDCSSDSTYEKLEEFVSNNPGARIIDSAGVRLGAVGNFFRLLFESDADYFMFCDADDFWFADKVEKTFDLMLKIEDGGDKPVLIHTDLSVADSELNIISDSLFKYEKLSPERKSLKNLIVQNNVTGCTVMINGQFKNYLTEIPEHAVMHDWWLALIAAAFGKIGILYEPTMLYRQHGKNQIGAYNAGNLLDSARRLSDRKRNKLIYESMFLQAESFAKTYRSLLTAEQYETVFLFGEMKKFKKLKKILTIFTKRYFKNSFLRNVGQIIAI